MNGKQLGVLWCAPWRVDITDVVKASGNNPEISVTNLWCNRVVHDLSLPVAQRLTKTHEVFRFDMLNVNTPILESGLLGPNHQVNKTANNPKEYSTMENQSIEAQIASLKRSMTDYMRSAQPHYTEKDIEKCVEILTGYNIKMANSKSKEDGMQIVKTTVLKLNELNENSGKELIETREREAIAAIIITVGHNKGYNSEDEDTTEDWREW